MLNSSLVLTATPTHDCSSWRPRATARVGVGKGHVTSHGRSVRNCGFV